ncbi:MAG: hypothetical protein FWD63_08600 [Propionibacteriaceae bacterium]|nr:hypothetical protein [Propionibacteriaceae bacterium]
MSDVWRDDSLFRRAVKVLQAIGRGVGADDLMAAQTAIETDVANGLARQADDMAAVGAPVLAQNGMVSPQRAGYLTYVGRPGPVEPS